MGDRESERFRVYSLLRRGGADELRGFILKV